VDSLAGKGKALSRKGLPACRETDGFIKKKRYRKLRSSGEKKGGVSHRQRRDHVVTKLQCHPRAREWRGGNTRIRGEKKGSSCGEGEAIATWEQRKKTIEGVRGGGGRHIPHSEKKTGRDPSRKANTNERNPNKQKK